MNESPKKYTNTNNKKLKVDTDTINLVRSIFLDISNNQEIPKRFRSILVKLSNRYLSIAAKTPNLFAIENHQARVFLKEACIACIKWKLEDDKNNLYLKKFESIVEEIIANETYNNKEFIKHQKDLEKVLLKLRKRAEVKKKRLKEKLLGQEKIEQAKKSTTLAIKARIADKNIPAFVNNILKGEWMSVLNLLHIRHGIASAEYQSRLDFVDLLLGCLQPKDNNSKQQLNLLIKKYKEGLALVAFNQQEISTKQEKLIENITHLYKLNAKDEIVKPKIIKSEVIKPKAVKPKIIKPKTIQKKPKAKRKVTNTLSDTEPEILEEIERQLENIVDYSKIVASLKTGTWFEIIDGNNKIKVKLSWISPITGDLLFVDSQGLKITDKTSFELETELESQSFKIITVID